MLIGTVCPVDIYDILSEIQIGHINLILNLPNSSMLFILCVTTVVKFKLSSLLCRHLKHSLISLD